MSLHVSGDVGSCSIEVARDGADRQVVWRADAVEIGLHPTPADAAASGCGWPATIEIPLDPAWRSGYYAVTLAAGDERADACFVIRPRLEDPAPILLVLATTTWNAYNDWGGPSLYTGGTRVSFERPFAKGFLVKPEPVGRMMQTTPDREAMGYRSWARPLGLSDWSGGAGWWNWERPFLRWAESNGYRVDVATSHDLDAHPEILDGHRLTLHVGHDEYWSWGMRDALDAHVAAGGNAAIFSGNTCFWQIRFEDDGRAMTCFKYRAGADDPVLGTPDERFLSGIWSDRRVGRPETSTIGLTFTRGGYSRYGLGVPRASGGYTVARPTTGRSRARASATATRSASATRSSRTRSTAARSPCATGCPSRRTRTAPRMTLEILATAPARLWSQDEQPTRYAHEPGELEHVAAALVRRCEARRTSRRSPTTTP